MNIKKSIGSYFIISIVFPVLIYIASINGNDKIKELASALFIPMSIIIFIYSIVTIKYVFSNREHEIVDLGYVLRNNILVILSFIVRYIAVSMLGVEQIPKGIIQLFITPLSFLIIIPFIKNYCLNKRTILVTIISTIALIYIIMPISFTLIEHISDNSSLYLTNVFNKYYIYEATSNEWVRNTLELLNVELSSGVMLIVVNFAKCAMYCIVFLPYFVINSVLIDELTYRELSTDFPKRKIAIVSVILIICLLVCIEVSNKGTIELIYNMKH